MDSIQFPKDFVLGTATASTQIEGGETNSNWNDWYRKGGIKDGTNPARANDHYNRYREDIDLMASLNIKAYRMSIEWSRLEPTQGELCEEAVQHYIDELSYLREKGISVLLTLHHFNNPMWFENLGGFLNKKSPEILNSFCERIVKRLGHLVDEYITINEPNVYATSAYYFGEFPPGKKSVKDAVIVMTNLAKAHIAMYNTIHTVRKEMGFANTKVGYASHVRVFEPERPKNPVDIIGAKLMERMFQGGLDTCSMTGKAIFPIINKKDFVRGKYYDFIGINYYARSVVRVFDERPIKNSEYNDMGWEIYPEGIRMVAEKYFQKFDAPIYITENGIPDRNDTKRTKFIYDHLKELLSANADVRRYYYWTFIDNFEWMDGEHERFGLVENDYETQTRTVRKSGEFYRDIIASHGITDELIQKYF
ncbi:MAG: glycoside hydrolase family 1 protein [Clostridia bacterium]|nr:glycoside hydrolase family 1 protein [Clostridia bacterium]